MSLTLPAFPLGRSSRRLLADQHGFTLLEVLVAIVVLSFGVLGVVGLQAAALQANKDARYQSTAVALGRELGDLMRGNKDLAAVDNSATNPFLGDYTTLPTTTTDCYAAACASPNAVATHNMRDWLTRVQAALPGARVVVCFDDTAYDGGGQLTWGCTSAVAGRAAAVVKIGWTRQGFDRSASQPISGSTRPSVVLPLIPGSTT